jgi:hypothetical protein
MKVYRLVTLFAAVLITVSLTRILSHEKVGDPMTERPFATAADSP